jgi:hypothetical protein
MAAASAGATALLRKKAPSSRINSLRSASGMNTLGGIQLRSRSCQRIRASKPITSVVLRSTIGRYCRADVPRVKRLTKLLTQGEAAERILMHAPSEVHVTVLAFEFGLVEGDVGVLVEHERVSGIRGTFCPRRHGSIWHYLGH